MGRLSEYLVERKLVTRGQLDEAVQHQVLFGGRLGTNLVELGRVSVDELAQALSETTGAPLPTYAWLEAPEADAVAKVSRPLVERYRFIPLRLEGRLLHLAVMDPDDEELLDALRDATDCRLKAYVLPEVLMQDWLEWLFQVPRAVRQVDTALQPQRASSMPAGTRSRGPGAKSDRPAERTGAGSSHPAPPRPSRAARAAAAKSKRDSNRPAGPENAERVRESLQKLGTLIDATMGLDDPTAVSGASRSRRSAAKPTTNGAGGSASDLEPGDTASPAPGDREDVDVVASPAPASLRTSYPPPPTTTAPSDDGPDAPVHPAEGTPAADSAGSAAPPPQASSPPSTPPADERASTPPPADAHDSDAHDSDAPPAGALDARPSPPPPAEPTGGIEVPVGALAAPKPPAEATADSVPSLRQPDEGVETASPDGETQAPARPRELATLEIALAQAEDRRSLIEGALRAGTALSEYAALFGVHRGVVEGLSGVEAGGALCSISEVRVDAKTASVLAVAAREQEPSQVVLGQDAEAMTLRKALDRPMEGDLPAMLFPISLRGRLINLLYVDNGGHAFAETSRAALASLAKQVSGAYGLLILRRKGGAS